MSSAPTAADAPTYVDSSAVVKLTVLEDESDALRAFLRADARRLAASALLEVETARAVRVAGGEGGTLAEVLAAVDLVDVTFAIRARARTLEPAQLRTLDAIHLATAIEIGAHEMLVYDRRLAAAATAYGLRAWSPGV
jgi:predicted nucleic acid-binding protein